MALVTVSFLGIDLAWQSERNPTGAAALTWAGRSLHVTALSPALCGLSAVQEFIEAHSEGPAIIAVDAPLIIGNQSGLRPCERAVGQRYGSRNASCHASNLGLYPDAASVRLATWLATRGFVHATEPRTERMMLEVYPHAAYVALFDLPSIIRYKKGNVAAKAAGLATVQRTLSRLPIEGCPALQSLLTRNCAELRGKARKEFEDLLDALFCAYLAFHYWRFAESGSELIGDCDSGYIVNPRLSSFDATVAAV